MKTKVFFLFNLLVLTFSIVIQAQQVNIPGKKTTQGTSPSTIMKPIPYQDDISKLYGFKDSITDKIVIPAKYIFTKPFFEGLAAINIGGNLRNDCWEGNSVEGGNWGFINKTGNLVISSKYGSVENFINGIATVSSNKTETLEMQGFINKAGVEVVPMIYDYFSICQNGLICAHKNEKSGIIDRSNKIIVPFIYSYISDFCDGLASAGKDDKYGFIDNSGKIIIPFIYDSGSGLEGGLARAEINGKNGFIDKTGKIVIPIIYSYATIL